MTQVGTPVLTPVGTTSPGPWSVTEAEWDPARANYFETIFTVGNGRLGTRGSLSEGHLGAVSGTYLAGVYDAHDSQVIDLVNAPDWLDTEVFVDGRRRTPIRRPSSSTVVPWTCGPACSTATPCSR
ncbi:hypothetical protein [Tsukamurella sp. PLM1]|uniref:hypothetical protein n=1 Tax=Tsukamurella sp. PLM1 TaxID=2929795 RepID=UPI002111FCD7|nr:hypothetical protein [Tsukamurella sp. PLM1]